MDHRARRCSVRPAAPLLIFLALTLLVGIPWLVGCGSGSASSSSPLPQGRDAQAVAFQINPSHTGAVRFGLPLKFPDRPAWSVDLGGFTNGHYAAPFVSYPLIVNGRVYITGGGTAPYLYALDLATGRTVWGPIDFGGVTGGTGLCYDNEKVFVVNNDGLLQSFDAATGKRLWSLKLPGAFLRSGGATAANGVVYIGADGATKLCAVDEKDGTLLWTAKVNDGADSAPAITPSGDAVYVSYVCQVYGFDAKTGALLWHHDALCGSSGGKTAAYSNGLVYARDEESGAFNSATILDGQTGSVVGRLDSGPIPAFSDTLGFFVSDGTLRAIDPASRQVRWTFTESNDLASAPVIVDSTLFVGSKFGTVYAIDAATGASLWAGSAPSFIGGNEQSALAAGEGYLVVPAGSTLTAWRVVGP